MNAAQHQRLMAHFDALCDLPGADRDAEIARLAQAEPDLAAELRRLLVADGASDSGLTDQVQRVAQDALYTSAESDPASSLVGTVLADRYRLQARIGMGGAGEVYRAHDTQTQTTVAIKLLRAQRTTPRERARFRREFRAIARLDHPAVLRVFTEGQAGERRYFVMEWMAGGDLSRLIGAPLTTLLPIIIELTSALDHVHRARIVHRDLKPANILLDDNDPPHPKLADFGIVKLTEATGSSTDGVVGTVDYLAPEQAQGRRVDPRTDLYALGSTLYVLLTGRPPFDGAGMERLTRRILYPAPSLGERRPDVPAALVDLVDRLLATAPEDRPESAYVVGRALVEILEDLDASIAVGQHFAVPRQGGFLYPPGCVGREAEEALLVDHLSQPAAFAWLFGVPGGGKSTLSTAVMRTLRNQGAAIIRVAARDEGAPPFAPFPELVAALDATPVAPRPDGPARDNPYGSGGAHARRRIVRDVLTAIEGRRGRVVVLLEDLHDAGPDARLVLAELRAALPDRLSILATARTHARDALRAAVSDAACVDLAPLDDTATRELISRMLGARGDALSEALLTRLSAAAGGNPLWIVSAVAGLVNVGALRRGEARWTFAESVSDADVQTALNGAITARLNALPDDALAILSTAAVFGHRFDADGVAALAELDRDAVLDAIDAGLRAGVLRSLPQTNTDRYGFEHARYADGLLDKIPADRLARLHDRAGALLAASDQGAGARPGEIAYHFERGTDPARATQAGLEAAEVALAAFDYGAAEAHLRAGLARTPDHRPTQERLADALVSRGLIDEAVELYRALEAGATTPLDTARLLRKRGIALMRSDRPARGLDALRGALTVLGDGVPKGRAAQYLVILRDLALSGLGRIWRRWSTDPVLRERAYLHRELAQLNRWIDLYAAGAHVATFSRLAERLRDPQYRIDAYAFIMFFFALLGMGRRSDRFQAHGMRLALDAADEVGVMRLELIRGGTEMMVRADPAAARAQMMSAVERAERLTDPFNIAFSRLGRAWAALMLGDLRDAAPDLEIAHAQARAAGTAWLEADAAIACAIADCLLGRFDQALERSHALLASEIRLAFPVVEAVATEVVGGVAFMQGHYHDAVAHLERAMSVYTRHGLNRGWGFLAPLAHVEALCCLADAVGDAAVPDLLVRLKRSQRWIRRVHGPRTLYRGAVPTVRGIIASRRGQIAKARRLFAKAMTVRTDSADTYIDTWIQVRFALERHRWGDPPAAVGEALDQVAALYVTLNLPGMAHWLTHVRAERGLS